MSADIYCQIINNFYLRNNIILSRMERRGKGLAAGETERECARDGESLKMELASILRTAIGRRINYFGISREPNIRITFSRETILMGKGDQQRYINISKIEIIFADTWQHFFTMTFHLRFP